jgi:hypothetical protein
MTDPITATILAGGKLVWDSYGEDFTKWFTEKFEDKAKEKGLEYAGKGWDKVKWHQAGKDYLEKVAKLYGTTRILGNSEPTPLEGIFTDLYILDKPLAMRRYNIEQLQACDDTLHGHNMERKEGITVVKQANSHRLFILGKPGAGKTTFLKYVTLQAVKGELPQTPIFVGLREWSESNKTLMEFIVEQFGICNFPKAESFIEYLLEKGKAILLLDGLDEVNNEHNHKVIKSVKDFCKKYDKTQCLITCRVAAADYSFEAFKYMEVADFTDAQIETFVKKWFANEPIKCDKFLTEFKQEQYRGLRELASSPLLLGMLCLAFADSMEFSTRRVDIYEDAIDALLRKWDTSRSISRDVIYHGLTHQLKKRLFNEVAYKTFSDNQYLIKEKNLADYLSFCLKKLPNPEKQDLDGEVVLKAIEAQHGIFVERAQKIHSFAHLTFQEYFAACAIKGNVNYQKELMKHITDKRWREVFLLTASLLDDADDFFVLLKNAIDNLIEQDEKIFEFLQSVKNKANSVQSPYQIRKTQFLYLFLELCLIPYSFDIDILLFTILDMKSFSAAYDIGCRLNSIFRISNYDYDRHSLALIYALQRKSIKINFQTTSELKLSSKDISLDYMLYISLMIVLLFSNINSKLFKKNINENYFSLVEFYLEVINKSFELGFDKTARSLMQLKDKIPAKTASQNDWKLFYQKLSEVLQSERNIGKQWSFNDTQIRLLINYLDTDRLLHDCLKLATVSDREAIKNSLFLPPV